VHCWVTDDAAMRLDRAGRSAIVRYLTRWDPEKTRFLEHQLFDTGRRLLEPVWQHWLREFGPDFSLVGSADLARSLNDTFEASGWPAVEQRFARMPRGDVMLKRMIFTKVWPRLDENVTKDPAHLIKMPFCAHPATGRLCVPFDPRDAMQFLPDLAPHVSGAVDLRATAALFAANSQQQN